MLCTVLCKVNVDDMVEARVINPHFSQTIRILHLLIRQMEISRYLLLKSFL